MEFLPTIHNYNEKKKHRSRKKTPMKNTNRIYTSLVGGFKPFEKYVRQIGSFPQGSG